MLLLPPLLDIMPCLKVFRIDFGQISENFNFKINSTQQNKKRSLIKTLDLRNVKVELIDEILLAMNTSKLEYETVIIRSEPFNIA